ncbi:MAG: hypothetical protein NC321_11125 [Clostridium sp.]|nr:hypothetical protein [Clostridium sp.]
MRIPFKQFKPFELSEDIKKVVEFSSEEKNNLEKFVETYIFPRLQIFYKHKTIYYIFEEEYTETEWKDMISVHYINTTYQTKRTVMRVHLFSEQQVSNENYLGFFTLRSIDDTELMLSYVYPNWKNLLGNLAEDSYFMTYKKRVHIYGKELIMYTYPLFVQDSVVTSCSHASMISMSRYLKGKYNYKNIRILDINDSYTYGRKKIYPTMGLDPIQMLEILDTNGIPIDYKLYSDKMNEAVRAHIDFCVESAMPVLLGIHTTVEDEEESGEHVVQIVGYTLSESGERKYIIYDDSGYYIAYKYHLKNIGVSFVDIATWDEIKEMLQEDEDNKYECGFIMYPLHEKIYTLYDELIHRHCDSHLKRLQEIESQTYKRVLVADNNTIKEYLSRLLHIRKGKSKDKIDEEYEKEEELEIKRLLSQNLPHYIWVLEIGAKNDKRSLIIANPTLNPTTRKSIFLTDTPITIEEEIILLNDFS